MDKKILREAQRHIGEALSFITAVRDDENEKYEEKTDTWKESDKGIIVQEKIEALSELVEMLETADGNIEQVMQGD